MAVPVLTIGLGATRAGTSWLNRYLTDHPECHLREVKEVHYFDTLDRGSFDQRLVQLKRSRARLAERRARLRDTARIARIDRALRAHDSLIALFGSRTADDAAYLAYLHEGAGSARLVGEITPAYALLPESRLRQIHALAPMTRFFYVLRDPLQRLWSNIRQTVPQRPGGDRAPERVAREMLDRWLEGNEPELAARCDYRGAVQRISAAIPDSDRMFLFYETLFSESTLRRLTDFLGISAAPANTARRVYGAVPVRLDPDRAAAARARLAPQYAFVEAHFGALPPGWTPPNREV